MFEYHGWARVVLSPTSGDIWGEDAQMIAFSQRLSSYIGQLRWGNDAVGMKWINGQLHVWATGFHNHRDPIAQESKALFTMIGQWAPGSYGMLYFRDDEEGPTETRGDFQVYALIRGVLTQRPDPYFSPIIPILENP